VGGISGGISDVNDTYPFRKSVPVVLAVMMMMMMMGS
jgi:hypothetical protein